MLKVIIKLVTVLLISCLLTACAGIPLVDPVKNTNWQAPARFNSTTVYNMALRAISQEGVQVTSTDRKAGVITVKKVAQGPLTKIPSEFSIKIIVSRTGGRVVLSTTSYITDVGKVFTYSFTINSFYNNLFTGLNIHNANEMYIDKSDSSLRGQKVENTTYKPVVKSDPLVKEMQQLLNRAGYNVGVADGLSGSKTRSAVSSFQQNMGLPVNGQLNTKTVQALRAMVPQRNTIDNTPNNIENKPISQDSAPINLDDEPISTDNTSIDLDDLDTDDTSIDLDDL